MSIGLRRYGLALGCTLGGAFAIVPFQGCDVGDAICPDDTVEENRDDDCPYGPPGGPQRKNAERCVVELDPTGCTVTFRDDVYPILVGSVAPPRSGGGCADVGCHGAGSQGGARLLIPAAVTADDLYTLLSGYRNDLGDPYIEQDNENAWFGCNVEAKIGGGSAMPPPAGLTDAEGTLEDDADLTTVQEWIRCGMKLDGAGTGGAGGGA